MVMEIQNPNPLSVTSEIETLAKTVYFQLDANTLVEQTLTRKLGEVSDTGALCIQTGKFTGRSPKDKFIVKDDFTRDTIDWGEVNIPISTATFERLLEKMSLHIKDKEVWVRHCYAGADPNFQMNVTVINTSPWANLFCHHLFLRPSQTDLKSYLQEWVILQVPEFLADPETDGTRQENFTVVDFTKKMILIGGSAYTGEMKKGIFSVLN
ncbi:MAG: phosphoenolpyruvate carboxykinase (ATP), partial [Sphingobacterium sp.]